MSADLHRIILRCKIFSLGVTKLLELILRRAIESGRNVRLETAAASHAFELSTGLGMVGYHLLGEFLFRPISLLLSNLSGLDLQHVTHCRFLHEVGCLWRNAKHGVSARFLACGLRQGSSCKKQSASHQTS